MKLSTPKDDPGGRIDQAEDTGSEAPALPVIENLMTKRLSVGPQPLDSAVEVNGDMLDSVFDQIANLEDRVDELEEENAELREHVEKMDEAVRVITKECPDCGGELKGTGGVLTSRRLECDNCERTVEPK